MGVAVLGPLQVDGQAAALSPRDRVVLSALAVRAGRTVSVDALADALWGDRPPPSWTKVLQGCVVRLRKRLGAAAIESVPGGYRLTLTEDELDHRVFEELLQRSRVSLAGGDAPRAAYLAQESLDLWRGPALPDLEEWSPAEVETSRLDGLRREAEEVLVEAELACGRAREVTEQARTLVARAPFRERRWALLARALHQSGREPEALAALRQARTMLVEEFGLDPGPELVGLESMLLRDDPSLRPDPVPPPSGACPYRGLLAYDAEDEDTFFGREDDVAACLRRLRESGVLAVVGSSGVGKSSLVRAGVVPALTRSGAQVLLTHPGARPLDSLSGLRPRGRQTLVVDQAEEAVTLCADPAEQARYFAALAVHVGSGGALVLVLRADHLGDLAAHPEVARVLEDGMYLLGPMGASGLRSAIEGPARRAGLRLEPGLVDLLVREVEGEPAALPLLSHVLCETWERREGPTLTVAGYRATGGIRQAVAQSAESLYDGLDAQRRAQLRSLMLRLVVPSDGGDPVRTRLPRERLSADPTHERLLEQLVGARLVTVDGESVQIAHEALVRVWPRLRGWLDDDVEGQRLHRHLAGAADAWDAMDRPDSELYRGMRLNRAEEWRDRAGEQLDGIEAQFLEASSMLASAERRAAEGEARRERRARRRLAGAVGGGAVFLALSLVAGTVAVRQSDRAAQERRDRTAAATLAEARRAGALAATQQDVRTGLLLAAEALHADDSPQAWDNLARVLSRTGSLVSTTPFDALAVSLSLSPDGSLLAVSAAPDAPVPGVHLFDAGTMAQVDFAEPTPPSSAIEFSPDGRQLAVAVNQWVDVREKGHPPRLDDLPLRLYDMPGGTLGAHQLGGWRVGDTIEYALAFSGDGHRIAAVVQNWDARKRDWTVGGRATVWDLRHPRRPLLQVQGPDYAQVDLDLHGRTLYVGRDGRSPLRAYDVATGRLVASAREPLLRRVPPGDVSLSPDGRTLAVSVDDRVVLYDSTSLRRSGPPLRGHSSRVGDVDWSADGRSLVSAADADVIVWDARSRAEVRRFDRSTWNAALSPRGTRLYLQSSGELLTFDVDPARGVPLGEGTPAAPRRGYVFSLPAPGGRVLARLAEGRLSFVDTRTGATTPRSAQLTELWGVRWSPDARHVLTWGPDSLLRVWDARSGRQVARRRHFTDSLEARFSRDGRQVLVPDGSGRLETLDVATLQPVHRPVRVGTGVSALVPGVRDGAVLVASGDGTVRRMDPVTGEVLAERSRAFGAGSFVASPDGRLVAGSDLAGVMRLFDARTLEWVGPSSGAPWGEDRDYAPDGRQIAAVVEGRVSLWDGRTGAYQASLPVDASGPLSVAYLADGSGLVVAAADGRTWTVDTRVGAWVSRACTLAGRNLSRAEWRRYFPSRDYRETCPGLSSS
jgi:DNA-binding SARP family transcriptional activator/WD40 repeat protein